VTPAETRDPPWPGGHAPWYVRRTGMRGSERSFHFSRRTAHSLEANPLSRALAAARARGREILDLTVSNPTRASIDYDTAAILGALSDPRGLVYEPAPLGIESAREAVARENGVDTSRVMLTASTSEAYAFLFKLLCDPGDEVLVPAPSYPLFDLLAAFEGVHLVPYRLAYDGAWHVDLDSARRAKTARTRAIVLVSPNNPTGSYLKRAELDALAALELPLISDEVFASYPLGAGRAGPSALSCRDSLVFALGGLSKVAALPQMKLAWTCVAGPDPLVRGALDRLELLGDTFLSASTPVQIALPALLASRHRAEEAIRARTRDNLARLRELVGPSSAATVLDVEGGWYAIVRVPRTKSEEQWAIDLVEQDGVYVHPGHFFGFADEAYLVLSLLTDEATFAAGVRRVVSAVDRT
jgi:alanine-synthesizing transaminase